MKLPSEFYLQSDVKKIARHLLGKILCTNVKGIYTSGIISETEAYEGKTDKASHAWNGRFTERTQTMYEQGGIVYVYLCYGLHNMFNVITNVKDIPHAILIRAVQPVEGIEHMEARKGASSTVKNFSIGPGNVCKIMGIDRQHNGVSLEGNNIWIEDRKIRIPSNHIQITPRIGIDYAEEDTARLNRYVLKNNKYYL